MCRVDHLFEVHFSCPSPPLVSSTGWPGQKEHTLNHKIQSCGDLATTALDCILTWRNSLAIVDVPMVLHGDDFFGGTILDSTLVLVAPIYLPDTLQVSAPGWHLKIQDLAHSGGPACGFQDRWAAGPLNGCIRATVSSCFALKEKD